MSATPWAPVLPIRTARLDLRGHRTEDLDDLLVFHGDPVATRYLPWPVRDRKQTEEALQARLSQDVASREGDWLVLAIEERATGRVIGEVDLKRGADGRAELGYVMRGDRQGIGLASEAARALLHLAFSRFGVVIVEALIERGNDASVRLVERLGFIRTAAIDHLDAGAVIEGYVLHRSAYEAASSRPAVT
ncbi:GNAT family N-acetyltransferase [Lysobacter korlensis]|uniref:GNAT family N-acetyltransferase n=1 Tax=Lysobacter korlensis TaxID=553636 RepID=A0ABV6RWA2_9GAMM